MDDETRAELAALRGRLEALYRGLALHDAVSVLALLAALAALLLPACG